MKNKTQELIKELDELNQNKWSEIYKALKDVTDVYSIGFNVYLSEEMLTKFNLNKDIVFSVKNNNGVGKMKYYYKGIEIEPDCYYLRPDNYTEVTLLEILQECLTQNTYNPNIKHLEVKESF